MQNLLTVSLEKVPDSNADTTFVIPSSLSFSLFKKAPIEPKYKLGMISTGIPSFVFIFTALKI